MDNTTRVLVNTSVQYIKTIFNVLISLFSTRLILNALGVEDYGIYILIAGIVTFLSFLVNAMVITTQRYISYYISQDNIVKLKFVFNTSLLLHLIIGLIVIIFIVSINPFLFNGFLDIPHNRLFATKIIYHITALIVFVSFITAPYRALLISHENIIYICIIDIIDSLLKLILVLLLIGYEGDKLILYVILMGCISLFDFFAFFLYDRIKYEECCLPSLKYFDTKYIKNLFSFTGWTIYSVGCIMGRTQGLAIVINKYFGLVINAAYGISIQVNGSLMFLSQSLLNAMNPQIIKAEGEGNRKKMLRLAEIESKFSFFLISMLAIPLIFEMEGILTFWLGDFPDISVTFCRFVLLASMVDQLTIGLGTANQAIGFIRNYSLAVNTIKIATIIPIVVISYTINSVYYVMSIYLLFELICAVMRLFFLKKTAGLSILEFCTNVFYKEIIPILAIIIISYLIVCIFDFKYRFLLTLFISIIVYVFSIYCFGLCDDEKNRINKILNDLLKK